MLMTTTHGLPDLTIVHTYGLVVACMPFWGSKYAEGISNLQGTTNADVPAAFEARRAALLERLAGKAEERGANAIVGLVMHDREITPTWKELCAYGTAVIVGKRSSP